MSLRDLLVNLSVPEAGPWAYGGARSERLRGWKIHLTATPDTIDRLVARVASFLGATSYKIVRSYEMLRALNAGELGMTQRGKAITIYPATDEIAQTLVSCLVERTQDCLAIPRVPTDYYLGGAVFVRNGIFAGDPVRDRFGMQTRQFTGGGETFEDEYAPSPPEEIPGDWPFKERPVERDYAPFDSRILLREVLSSGPRGTVTLATDTRMGDALVVIKQARAGVTFASGNSAATWLLNERRALDAIYLAGCRSVPRVVEQFELAHDLFLSTHYYPHPSFAQFINSGHNSLGDTLRMCRAAAKSIADIHQCGWVHRDVSLNNLLFDSAKDRCVLIDLELAWSFSDLTWHHGFTPGFASPQQRENERPDPSDDWYGLLAIYVALRTGVSPRALVDLRTKTSELRLQLRNAYGLGAEESGVVAGGLMGREGAELALTALLRPGYEPSSLTYRTSGEPDHSVDASSMSEALFALPRASALGPWLSIHPDGGTALVPLRSANRGNAGVLYLISILSRKLGALSELREAGEFLVDWLLDEPPTHDQHQTGLHFGTAGVAFAALEAVSCGLIAEGPWLRRYARSVLVHPPDWPDITHGAAGELLVCLRFLEVLQDEFWREQAHHRVDYLLRVGAQNGAFPLPNGVGGLEGIEYTGFAHGAAGVAFALCKAAEVLSREDALEAASMTLKWLLSRMVRSATGQILWPLRSGGQDHWNQWCHGGPGIALALNEGARLFPELIGPELVKSALARCRLATLQNNLSTCCGSAGHLEVMIECTRVEDAELKRATALLASRLRARASQSYRWSTEGEIATADLFSGNGGIMHALLRAEDSSLRFPLL